MRPVSDRWLSTIRGSHKPVFEVRVIEPPNSATMATGTDPAGTVLPIRGGDVVWDTDSDILATVQVQVDPSYWPTSPYDLLAPYGNELWVRRGVEFANGATEWVSLGYYRINSVEQTDARGGSLTVSGSDRMWRLIKNPMATLQFTTAQTNGYVVEFLVTTGSVPATIEWDDTAVRDALLTRSIVVDNDRWDALNSLITSLGKIWYFDYRGILVIKDVPDTTTPVWEVNSGRNGVLVTLGRSISDDELCNRVMAIGAAPDSGSGTTPVSIVPVTDALPWLESPTKYGTVSKVVKNADLTDNLQCNEYARKILMASVGLPYSLNFDAVPNAALEPWDPIRVRLGNGLDATHVLRRLTIPLSTAGALVGETREYVTEI